MSDYTEQLLDAVSIITESYINDLEFNKTITGTIVGNTEAVSGKYTVSDSINTFTAYSSDTTYQIDDRVYIMILNNDSNSQKLILGKIITSDTTEYISNDIFSSFLDITNNLVQYDIEESLIANNINDDKSEKLLWYYSFNNIASGYSKLGIQADFKTLLNKYNLISGEYGLRIEIFTSSNYNKSYTLSFSNMEMSGSVYNFNSYTTQKVLFDISNIEDIKYIYVYLYQTASTFIDADGNQLDYEGDVANIFLKNLKVYLGYDKTNFTAGVDSALIYTNDLMTYSEEEVKTINLSWIHWTDETNCSLITSDNTDLIYQIRWYRYNLDKGSSDDAYLNKNWENVSSGLSNTLSFTTSVLNQTEQIQAVIICGEDIIYSDILTFENTKESLNPAIAESGLILTCDDETNGNYFVYGPDNQLIDSNDGTKERTITATYHTGSDLGLNILDESVNYTIEWNYDENSMFEVIEDPTNSTVLKYYIKKYYSAQYVNNTIKCTVKLTGTDYSFVAEKELRFGATGTQGADAIFFIDFQDNKTNAIIAGTTESSTFIARLFDNTNTEIDISTYTINWELNDTANYTIEKEEEDTNNIVIIKTELDTGFNTTDLLILTAKITTDLCDYQLEASLPIPITADPQLYNHINGMTRVLYATSGNLMASPIPYKLFNSDNEENTNATWNIIGDTISQISEKNILQPCKSYLKNNDDYGIQAKINNNIVWHQPIIESQNIYFSSTINQWDGVSLQLNESSGTIVGTQISAGKKEEDDNTFTGVIIGDFTDGSETDANTGVYGFKKGNMCYALKDDGTAFFGNTTSGGQIGFNGEKAIISSSDTVFDDEGDPTSTGTWINLYNGSARFGNNLSINEDGTLTLGNSTTKLIFSNTDDPDTTDDVAFIGKNINIDLLQGIFSAGGTDDSNNFYGKILITPSADSIIEGNNFKLNLSTGQVKFANNNFIAESSGDLTLTSSTINDSISILPIKCTYSLNANSYKTINLNYNRPDDVSSTTYKLIGINEIDSGDSDRVYINGFTTTPSGAVSITLKNISNIALTNKILTIDLIFVKSTSVNNIADAIEITDETASTTSSIVSDDISTIIESMLTEDFIYNKISSKIADSIADTITSDYIYNTLSDKIDTTITENSTNLITSGAVYAAVNTEQEEPTT